MRDRIDLLNYLISVFDAPCRYLEIGCAADDCFKHICAEDKTGVDPIRGGTERMTSDEFFATGPDSFDVIFIDGLHLKEQCARDFDNAEAHLKPGGLIVIHDALPPTFESTDPAVMEDALGRGEAVDSVGMWCGEVWRVLVDLRRRSDLDMVLWPHDLGCVIARPGASAPVKGRCATYQDWMASYEKWLPVVQGQGELAAWLND